MTYIYAVLRDEKTDAPKPSDISGVFLSHEGAVKHIKKLSPECYCTMETDYANALETEYCFETEDEMFSIQELLINP